MAPVEEGAFEAMLRLSGCASEEALQQLQESTEAAAQHSGLDISMLNGDVGEELLGKSLEFCRAVGSGGASLRLAHVELGSCTEDEQRVFDLKAEKEVRNNERAMHVKKKSESGKQKDFAASAEMRRTANAGIEECDQRLADIAEELLALEQRQMRTPWYSLFSQLKAQSRNNVRCLDLSDCGLHATGLAMLSQVMMDLEHRGEGIAVEELVLDGNDLGDSSTVALASLLRLTSCLSVLRLRNIGVTDGGLSQILSGLVSNKSVALLDLRGNGLCTLEISKAATDGFRRFNKTAQILLE
eukprot:TRINITY_DN67075_c0_g1_i1.p2 TRINITY_DN67075_c0_g1~~TRINITY_DN67075_c0_g1_i1.p2  ORF type:complete len:315 (+),score=87.37 TRINITY_DN67075_c0_g1_i1:49-945(+)